MSLSQTLQLNVPPGSTPPVSSTNLLLYGTIAITGQQLNLGDFSTIYIRNQGVHPLLLCVSILNAPLSQGLFFTIDAWENFELQAGQTAWDTLTIWDISVGVQGTPFPIPTVNISTSTNTPPAGYILITNSPASFSVLRDISNAGVSPWQNLLYDTLTISGGGTLSFFFSTAGFTEGFASLYYNTGGTNLTMKVSVANSQGDDILVFTSSAVTSSSGPVFCHLGVGSIAPVTQRTRIDVVGTGISITGTVSFNTR